MTVLFDVLLFSFGSVVGSYLGVSIDRFQTKGSANRGRSVCASCGHRLAALDLIPVISFFLLRARCRYCRAPIGWGLLGIELLSGLGTLFIAGRGELNLEVVGYLVAFWTALVIFAIDFRHYLIPDAAVIVLLVAALAIRLMNPDLLLASLIGAGVGFCVLGGLVLVTHGRGMGFGDVKLAIPLGFLLGWPKIGVGLLLAFMIGSIVGIGLLLTQKRRLKDAVPFGPFLLVGAGLGMLWGEQLIIWYLGIARF
jgi:leader peptidase (prepilin peptidase)/N-methyltransferase